MAVYPQRRALNAPAPPSNPFMMGGMGAGSPAAKGKGAATMTSGNWWENVGLGPAFVAGQEAPQVTVSGETYGFDDPWDFYQFTQEVPDFAWAPFYPDDTDPAFDVYDPQLPQVDPEAAEDPPWIADTLDRLLTHYESVLAPDYTGVSQFTPAVRGEIDRQIGGQLATAERGIRSSMGRSGMWNSGVAGQMEMMANMGAASASGQARAWMESQDQRRIQEDRARAELGMGNLYHQGLLDTERYGNLLAGLSPAAAAAMSPGLLGGPDYQWQDPAGWFGTSFSIEQLEQARQDAIDAGDYDAQAFTEALISMVGQGITDPGVLAILAGAPWLLEGFEGGQ